MSTPAAAIAADPNTASGLASGGDSFLGLAMMGKTSLSLLIVVGCLYGLSFLLKKVQMKANTSTGIPMEVVSSTALGTRDRVVMLKIKDEFLILGVSSGSITKLHTLPASDDKTAAATDAGHGSFGKALERSTDAINDQ